jgi:uncharacterized protein YqeY
MLIDTLKKENLLALKSKDVDKRAILSVVINKYMVAGYDAKANGEELSDADLVQIINKTLKELDEEREGYVQAKRDESVKKIDHQIEVIKNYLPKMLSEEEIKSIILKLDDKSIPSVMKYFKTNYAGKCDNSLVIKVLKSL